jgi:hypothetical protein
MNKRSETPHVVSYITWSHELALSRVEAIHRPTFRRLRQPGRVNGPYIRPSLRKRGIVRRTLRLGRSRNLWRGASSRGYLCFMRLAARGSLRSGHSGTRSAASVSINLVHSCRRFFLVRA